jgi:hypothetical protein
MIEGNLPDELFHLDWPGLSVLIDRGIDRWGFSLSVDIGRKLNFRPSTYSYRQVGLAIDWRTFFNEPNRFYLQGLGYRVMMGLGPGNASQVWDRRQRRWIDRWSWFVVYPDDHEEQMRECQHD